MYIEIRLQWTRDRGFAGPSLARTPEMVVCMHASKKMDPMS